MDDSVTENEFKLREIMVPVYNSVGSTGMSDEMWVYVGRWAMITLFFFQSHFVLVENSGYYFFF